MIYREHKRLPRKIKKRIEISQYWLEYNEYIRLTWLEITRIEFLKSNRSD